MAELPILFSGPMVRAILEGRKTVTRRVVKPQPTEPLKSFVGGVALWQTDRPDYPEYPIRNIVRSPYQPGDLLWVRETWAIEGVGRRVSLKPEVWPNGWPVDRLRYVATDKAPARDAKLNPYWWNARPSIHMPRWAARLFLRVTEVRVERLQVISGVDAVAEGCGAGLADYELLHYGGYKKARQEFRRLWDSLNAKRGFGWDSNPWVWVYRFERTEAPHG